MLSNQFEQFSRTPVFQIFCLFPLLLLVLVNITHSTFAHSLIRTRRQRFNETNIYSTLSLIVFQTERLANFDCWNAHEFQPICRRYKFSNQNTINNDLIFLIQ